MSITAWLIWKGLELAWKIATSDKAEDIPVNTSVEADKIKRRKAFEQLIAEGKHVIALDFGTSNSQVAYTDANMSPKLLSVAGKNKIPTVIYYNNSNDAAYVGLKAEYEVNNQLAAAENNFSRIDSVFKNYMAVFKPIFCAQETAYDAVSPLLKGNGIFFTWGEIVTEFFKFFKTQAEQTAFNGEKVEGICITCPVAFPSKALYEEAAKQAGFSCVDFMEEPRAAYLGYMQGGEKLGDNVLVFDMGGGTLDIAFLQKDGDTWAVKKTPMRIDAAGTNLDECLLQDVLPQVQASHPDLSRYTGDIQFLKYMREEVKETLGAGTCDNVAIRHYIDLYEKHFSGGSMTKEHFESLIMQCMDEKEVFPKLHNYTDSLGVPVDSILMVGGSSQLKCLQERMRQEFSGIKVFAPHAGDSVVALGALTRIHTDL